MGVSHSSVTGAQKKLYTSFSKTGKGFTWNVVKDIEIKALVNGGMELKQAGATVDEAINFLIDAGIEPTRIPWGG